MDLRVRNLEPWVVGFLRDEARHAGQNLAEYLRRYLRDAALRRRHDWAETLAAGRDEIRRSYGVLSDSADGIRQDREERG